LGNNINSNNFLEVLITGVILTPRVKYVSKCEGNRRVKETLTLLGTCLHFFHFIFKSSKWYQFFDFLKYPATCSRMRVQ